MRVGRSRHASHSGKEKVEGLCARFAASSPIDLLVTGDPACVATLAGARRDAGIGIAQSGKEEIASRPASAESAYSGGPVGRLRAVCAVFHRALHSGVCCD